MRGRMCTDVPVELCDVGKYLGVIKRSANLQFGRDANAVFGTEYGLLEINKNPGWG